MLPIEVNLISCTGMNEYSGAKDLLIYTKSTRLEQGSDTRTKIEAMSDEEKDKELEYMANTIPSSWEFVDFVFEIKNVTRAFTHQFVRTRTGSYAQQTMRMLNKKEFTYRIPPRIKENKELNAAYCDMMKSIQQRYDSLIANGVEVEDARGILPTNIHTNIIAKFNLRTLAEMGRSRTGYRTQDEYREVMEMMIASVLKRYPWCEKFISPPAKDHLKKVEDMLVTLKPLIKPEAFYDTMKSLDKVRKGE